ncbi:hypothetical protein GS872_26030, partial [Rhodococcus hoagii]|nr:hypothetical protein [Prescottella equi]
MEVIARVFGRFGCGRGGALGADRGAMGDRQVVDVFDDIRDLLPMLRDRAGQVE